jgi:hypothetical protein
MSMQVTPQEIPPIVPRYTRFNLVELAGDQVIDWVVINNNFFTLGTSAAHLGLANTFSQVQTAAGLVLSARPMEGGQPDTVVGLSGADGRLRLWPRSAIVPPASEQFWAWNGTVVIPTVATRDVQAQRLTLAGGLSASSITATNRGGQRWLDLSGVSGVTISTNLRGTPGGDGFAKYNASQRSFMIETYDGGMGWYVIPANQTTSTGHDFAWISNEGMWLYNRGQTGTAGQFILQTERLEAVREMWLSANGPLYMEASRAVYWQFRADLNRLWASWHTSINGVFDVSSSASVGGILTVNSRLITNNWDSGWANSLGGNTNMAGACSIGSTLTVGGAIQLHGAIIYFEPSNQVLIQWRGDLGALWIPYGNGINASEVTTGRVWTPDIESTFTFTVHTPNTQNCYFRQRGGSGWADLFGYRFMDQSSVDHAFALGLRHEPVANALDAVRAIDGYSYDHVYPDAEHHFTSAADGTYPSEPAYGFRASELAERFPELVGPDPDTGESSFIDYAHVVVVLWEAVKSLASEVDALKAR